MLRRTFLGLSAAFAVVVALMQKDAGAMRVTCCKRSLRRWTMYTHIADGEKCRFLGWTDEHGNVHVCIHDTVLPKTYTKWMAQPPAGTMHFSTPMDGFEIQPASEFHPGEDRREDRSDMPFVTPEFATRKDIPPDFDELWWQALPIATCDEGCAVFMHYDHLLKG